MENEKVVDLDERRPRKLVITGSSEEILTIIEEGKDVLISLGELEMAAIIDEMPESDIKMAFLGFSIPMTMRMAVEVIGDEVRGNADGKLDMIMLMNAMKAKLFLDRFNKMIDFV